MNDVSFIKEELERDDSWVNKRTEFTPPPLFIAIDLHRTEICRLLLEHGADPNASYGWPILNYALQHPDILKLLIVHRVNLKRRITWRYNRTGVWIIGDEATLLHYAIREGNLESVKMLIAAGLDPNAADVEGQTPLHIAVRFERWEKRYPNKCAAYSEIISLLIEQDASLQFTDKAGRTPLKLAEELESPEEIRKLLDKQD